MQKEIKDLFSGVSDPRVDRTKKHPLESVLYIALCSVMSGIETWTGMQDYAEIHLDILKKFIDLPSGPPSHDTIARVISALDVEEFFASFKSFTSGLIERTKGIISIDGKTIRGSFDKSKKVSARHIVSAWASECKLVLGQTKVDDKSNEIPAMAELLQKLDLKGQIITIDAMRCQREICQEIVERDGDYVIGLKRNQGSLFDDVDTYFRLENKPVDQMWEEWDKGHGRIEHRICYITNDVQWLQDLHHWPGLKSIAVVYSERQTRQKSSKSTRYYISSLDVDAQRIAQIARSHWSIENSLHWVLDVTFNEDKSRIRNENAPEIFNIIRKWSISLISRYKRKDTSIRRVTKMMAMSPLKLLSFIQKI